MSGRSGGGDGAAATHAANPAGPAQGAVNDTDQRAKEEEKREGAFQSSPLDLERKMLQEGKRFTISCAEALSNKDPFFAFSSLLALRLLHSCCLRHG